MRERFAPHVSVLFSVVLPALFALVTGCGAPSASGPEANGASTPPPAAATNAESEPAKEPETMPLSGSLTNEQIQATVNENAKAFDACYTLGADGSGKLEGTVTVALTVGPLGVVNEARVKKSTLKNPKVDACVCDAFKTLKFPRPAGGGTVMLTYPMTFGGEVTTGK